ncbi:hypothetical protein [Saccharopolyspora kobensis]|uniref:hypothetical protein n=1 Tax=Saccharopolyspora kobensis TaxID=146035 RepID=UPI003322D5F9
MDGECSDGDPDLPIGRIVAGNLDERFESLVQYWSRSEYESSWRRQLQLLLEGGSRALLLTVAIPPERANFLRGFELYRFGEQVRVHDKMVLIGRFPRKRSILVHPDRYVSSYRSSTRGGQRISEWYTTVSEIRSFLAS